MASRKLSTYRAKRDFSRTAEPAGSGEEIAAGRGRGPKPFMTRGRRAGRADAVWNSKTAPDPAAGGIAARVNARVAARAGRPSTFESAARRRRRRGAGAARRQGARRSRAHAQLHRARALPAVAAAYQLAQPIRGTSWGRRAMLIAITGWGQEQDKRRALAAGFDQHLTKPIDPSGLEALLQRAGARRQAVGDR